MVNNKAGHQTNVGRHFLRNLSDFPKIRLCKEYVGRKVNNASEFKFRRNLPLHVLPYSPLE